MAAVEATELYRFFHSGEEEVKALRGVDLTADMGEMIALVGPSGSGKSTLLMCLAGLDEPDGGTVHVMNEVMSRKPEIAKLKLRSRCLGIMRQKDNLFSHLTVSDNIHLAQSLSASRAGIDDKTLLGRIGIGDKASSFPPQLSGGERARAGLAVALACTPAALLLDEPTGEVDAKTETAILSLLNDYKQGGGIIIVATHNAAVAHMADRIVSLRDGKVVHE
jgi:putative ABC transport system ATP-binding protein